MIYKLCTFITYIRVVSQSSSTHSYRKNEWMYMKAELYRCVTYDRVVSPSMASFSLSQQVDPYTTGNPTLPRYSRQKAYGSGIDCCRQASDPRPARVNSWPTLTTSLSGPV